MSGEKQGAICVLKFFEKQAVAKQECQVWIDVCKALNIQAEPFLIEYKFSLDAEFVSCAVVMPHVTVLTDDERKELKDSESSISLEVRTFFYQLLEMGYVHTDVHARHVGRIGKQVVVFDFAHCERRKEDDEVDALVKEKMNKLKI